MESLTVAVPLERTLARLAVVARALGGAAVDVAGLAGADLEHATAVRREFDHANRLLGETRDVRTEAARRIESARAGDVASGGKTRIAT